MFHGGEKKEPLEHTGRAQLVSLVEYLGENKQFYYILC